MLKGRDLMVERIKMRIKGQDLAKIIGITQSYVSKMENERQVIPLHIYKKWISVLKINN